MQGRPPGPPFFIPANGEQIRGGSISWMFPPLGAV